MAPKTTKAEYFPYTFFEGGMIRTEDAKVSIMTNALQYGTGFFGGIRGYYDIQKGYLSLFRLDDHIARFLSSAKILGVTLKYSHADLKKIILDLVKKNKPQTDCYIRPFGYAGSINLAPNLARDNVFSFSCYMIPLGDYIPTESGISVAVSSWRRISDNVIPSRAKISGSYVNSALAKLDASQKGCVEAILLNENGTVSEGSAMNLFIVRDNMLITNTVTDNILEGITRRTVIQIATDLKIPVVERSIDRTELYIADEAFFSGTGAQVAWISEIDGRKVGTGKKGSITAKIQKQFFDVVRGKIKKYDNWCTKISYNNLTV